MFSSEVAARKGAPSRARPPIAGPLLRREGLAKLMGREPFVDDVRVEGCWWGMTARSPAPRGRIRRLRFGRGVDWSQFTVVTAADLPGCNVVHHGLEPDQPILAAAGVRHVHEPVVLVAHPSREMARRAVREIEIEVDAEPPVLDYRLPPTPEQIQHGTDNVFKRLVIEKGDLEAALAGAAHVIEGCYESGSQEHVYLETQGMLAFVEQGVVTVQGSMQCPYYVHEALVRGLGRPADAVRVIQLATGGGFGGKEEFPSGLALHAAALALAAGRPVKIVYDRDEDMAATTKRHPARIRHRTGVDRDGRLLGQHVEILLDGGAYTTLSPVVLSRAAIHAAGPYACDNVRIEGRAVLSNSVPFGAFRGFGAPQSHFARERHLDGVALRLGLDPAELRRRNLLRDGETTATGQTIADGVDRRALQDRALELAAYREKRETHASFNRGHAFLRRGIGLASFHHGAGFTGNGETELASELEVAGLPDGRVEVLCAGTEMGQGTTTILTQLAAARLGLPLSAVVIARPDTRRVPNSGPTVASRTAMVVGKLVENACDDLRRRAGLGEGTPGEALSEAIRGFHREHPGGELRGHARYVKPAHVEWDADRYRGAAYAAYAWATYVAEVEVDLRTYATRVISFVAVQEVGRVLNEVLARGQVQGGVVQGIGWALLEACRWREGAMQNTGLADYSIPTSGDVPSIRVEFLEQPYAHGGQGAKGLGELPMDGPAPAIANAIANATGTDPRCIPLTPERLMVLLRSA
jgi:CO/xanthine dehydrogenase Mo-binding subunit